MDDIFARQQLSRSFLPLRPPRRLGVNRPDRVGGGDMVGSPHRVKPPHSAAMPFGVYRFFMPIR
jgi:hypothetical protein